MSLQATTMGRVFQQKLCGVWRCQVQSAIIQTELQKDRTERITDGTTGELDSTLGPDAMIWRYSASPTIQRNEDERQENFPGISQMMNTTTKYMSFAPPTTADHLMETESIHFEAEMSTSIEPNDIVSYVPRKDPEAFCTVTGLPCDSTLEKGIVNDVGSSSADLDISDAMGGGISDGNGTNLDLKSATECEEGNIVEKSSRAKPYACKRCTKRFFTKHSLNRHRQVHRTKKSLKCSICDEKFKFRYELDNHVKMHTGDPINLTCVPCGKTYKTKAGLRLHMRSHTGEKPYPCEKCGEAFVDSTRLKTHMRTHTGEKPFMCSICGKTFPDRSGFGYHRNTHLNVRPYECGVCGRAFKHKNNRTAHEMTHREDKPFICEVCGKAFKQKSLLSTHKRVHSDSKRYTCETCGKSFHSSSNLKVHLRQHTGEKPYACNLCEKSFKQNVLLKQHLKHHHNTVDRSVHVSK